MIKAKHLHPNEKFHLWFRTQPKEGTWLGVVGTIGEIEIGLKKLFKKHPEGFWGRLSTLEDVNKDGMVEDHDLILKPIFFKPQTKKFFKRD